jgi:nucleoside transporter
MSENAHQTQTAGGGSIGMRLSVMMFLQFFVWGSWYVSMTGWFNEVGISGMIANAYSVGPIAGMVSPFFLGMVADRFFASQRVLSALHFIGGLLLLAVPAAASLGGNPASPFYPVTLVLFGHMLCYMPTLGLTNSLTLHNVMNPEKQFPMIRVWGTIGWIIGNWAVAFLPSGDHSVMQFQLAGGAGILLAIYSLTLPHTPPPSAGKEFSAREALGVDAWKLMAKPSFAVFVICSFLICIPLAGYYNYARNYVEATNSLLQIPDALKQSLPFFNSAATVTMSLGQVSEIFFMLVMPFFFARFGVKKMLLVGMVAWVLRYGFFAGAWSSNPIIPLVFLGVLLHGICYDFFFVTGQIYVDRVAHSSIRGQAQGFLILVTQGVGMFFGAQLFGMLVAANTQGAAPNAVINWTQVWTAPAIFAAIIAVIFLALFREDKDAKGAEEAQPNAAMSAPAESLPA